MKKIIMTNIGIIKFSFFILYICFLSILYVIENNLILIYIASGLVGLSIFIYFWCITTKKWKEKVDNIEEKIDNIEENYKKEILTLKLNNKARINHLTQKQSSKIESLQKKIDDLESTVKNLKVKTYY